MNKESYCDYCLQELCEPEDLPHLCAACADLYKIAAPDPTAGDTELSFYPLTDLDSVHDSDRERKTKN